MMTHWNVSDYDERFSARVKNSHNIHVNKMSYAAYDMQQKICSLEILVKFLLWWIIIVIWALFRVNKWYSS